MSDSKKGFFNGFGDLLRRVLTGSKDKREPTRAPSLPVSKPVIEKKPPRAPRAAPPMRDDGVESWQKLLESTAKLDQPVKSEDANRPGKKKKNQSNKQKQIAAASAAARELGERLKVYELKGKTETQQPVGNAAPLDRSERGAQKADPSALRNARVTKVTTVHSPPAVATTHVLRPDVSGRPATDIRIGIDFGTSYSKMAIGIRNGIYIVDWEGLCSTANPYLLPSEASCDSDGVINVGTSSAAIETRRELKVPFLEGRAQGDDEAWLVAYLANLTRYARAWLEEHHSRELAQVNPRWEFNLGLPTGSYAENQTLKARYEQIGRCAWALSLEATSSIRSAQRLLAEENEAILPPGLQSLKVIPEFAAQVAGYYESSQRREGIHLLVDVGAGTLDFACFFVHDGRYADREKIPIYSADVSPNGTHYLNKKRLEVIGLSEHALSTSDPVMAAKEFAGTFGVQASSIIQVDDEAKKIVAMLTNKVSLEGKTKNRTAPEFNPATGHRALRVFVTGGGSAVGIYPQGVGGAFNQLQLPLIMSKLPESDGVKWRVATHAPSYDRVSVAAGLTFSFDDIKVFLPSEIPLIAPLPVRPRVNHEDLYGR